MNLIPLIPHIRYICASQSKSKEERTLYYLGGEPEENDSRLTIGKAYEIRNSLFSPSIDIPRIMVWICSDDEDMGKVCQISLNNFGTIAYLRDKKIEQIIK